MTLSKRNAVLIGIVAVLAVLAFLFYKPGEEKQITVRITDKRERIEHSRTNGNSYANERHYYELSSDQGDFDVDRDVYQRVQAGTSYDCTTRRDRIGPLELDPELYDCKPSAG